MVAKSSLDTRSKIKQLTFLLLFIRNADKKITKNNNEVILSATPTDDDDDDDEIKI